MEDIDQLTESAALSPVTHGFIGTILYAAPEQLTGQAVDTRCDIWAFGAVFYELLTGWPPFIAMDIPELVGKVCNQGLPDEWETIAKAQPLPAAIILKCLAKNAAKRYQNFDALLRDWDQLIFIPGNSPRSLAANGQVTLGHPDIEIAWNYHFAHRRDRVWVSHSRSRWAAMKRCSEYRKLGAYDDAATCAATALSETGKPMLLARLLFSGEYDAHVKAVVDPALGINYPPASVMTMLLYQWMLSRVCQLIDEVELAVTERDALYEFCVKLIDRNLGFVNLLNTAAQIMHFMKHPIVAYSGDREHSFRTHREHHSGLIVNAVAEGVLRGWSFTSSVHDQSSLACFFRIDSPLRSMR